MSDRYAKYNKLTFDYPADRVLRITFDRPESFNSVDAETHTQMTDMWIDIDRDPDINAVIVTGAGKAFSAGGDFSLIENMIGNSHEIMKTWKEARGLVYNIINCNKPIISAINGPAAGAGLVVGILKIALGTAVELANGSQSAIRWTKYSLNNWLRQAGPIFDASTALEMLGFMSEDVKEGVLSHREKRAPNFRKDCPL